MDENWPVAQASRSAFSAYYPGGPIPTLQVASAFAMRTTSAVPPPDSAFATIMSLSQPQPQPRASPLIPRSVPAATPKTKSFSLPNALSRVGTPVAKGTWILGRGDETEDNGYVRTINQAPTLLGMPRSTSTRTTQLS